MTERIATRCCIAGGGPAGMMLGLLLARAGIEVVVLEKHADFLRDFRGDTLHPSTLEVIRELGLLEGLLALPHQRIEKLEVDFGGERWRVADFRKLPVACPYIALMPQWDFLDYLARAAAAYPDFTLRMRTEATELIREGGGIVGAMAEGPDGPLEIRADLVVAADGRTSVLRSQAGLEGEEFGVPMDVLWFRLDRPAGLEPPLGRFGAGRILILLPRGDYWQAGYVIPKGGDAALRQRPFAEFQAELTQLMPEIAAPIAGLLGWDAVKLLTVRVDRLADWCLPGFLCIGDAAHAMSPVAGVGINLAIQDAVAAANLLHQPLGAGVPGLEDLKRVQARRDWPTRMTQRLQLILQKRVIAEVLGETETQPRAPLLIRLFDAWPWLRRLPARLIGMGLRPEHVESPERGA